MNYLAHAVEFLDDPYTVAGVAVPDWLGLSRPRLRCRSRHALPFVACECSVTRSVARGVARHHADDDWFHQTAAFGDLSLEFARQVRTVADDGDGMRPSFLGHILVELLLDATLAERDPTLLDRYYRALAQVRPQAVAGAVSEMTGADCSQLAGIIERFAAVRFLYDYADDERLCGRLNQVMMRVGLPTLPSSFQRMLPAARALVARERENLLTPRASSPTPVLACSA